jgi:hypothetical protein
VFSPQRSLAEDGKAGVECGDRLLRVKGVRRGDHDAVEVVLEQFVKRVERARSSRIGDRLDLDDRCNRLHPGAPDQPTPRKPTRGFTRAE